MLKLSLLDNALDFILDAVMRLSNPTQTPSDIKYSILHLSSGIELLLKQCLLDEHWTLIFAKVDEADKTALQTGDFKSVDFKESINRLERVCSINLKNDRGLLEALRKIRNKIEHYQITISKDEAVSILVKVWAFILDFVSEAIDFSSSEGTEAVFDSIREKMVIHQRFIDERIAALKPEFQRLQEEGTFILDCPKCLQEALPLTGEDTECMFCRSAFTSDELMEEWLIAHEGWHYLDPKERITEPVIHECPECGMEGLYHFEFGGAQPPDPGSICFKCGATFDFCMRCDLEEECPDDELGVGRECAIYLKRGRRE